MRLLAVVAIVMTALASVGCAAPSPGPNYYGFPVDSKCAEFFGNSPMYGGNKALAYATNCTGGM
jgi:hypothetical protein